MDQTRQRLNSTPMAPSRMPSTTKAGKNSSGIAGTFNAMKGRGPAIAWVTMPLTTDARITPV